MTFFKHESANSQLLEDPDVLARVKADPRGFLEGLSQETPLMRG